MTNKEAVLKNTKGRKKEKNYRALPKERLGDNVV